MHLLLSLSLLVSQPAKTESDLPPGAIVRFGSSQFRHSSSAFQAELSPDGKLLASVGSDGMRLWDVATGKQLLHHSREHMGTVGAVSFSPDSKFIAGRRRHATMLWNLEKKEERNLLELSTSRGGNYRPQFSADGKRVAINSGDGKIRVWDTGTGKLIADWTTRAQSMVFSNDGKSIIAEGRDQPLRIWDVDKQEVVRSLKLQDEFFLVTMLALSPDNTLLAIGEGPHHQNGAIKTPMYFRVHEFATGKERYRVPMQWNEGFISAFAFAPDGKTMVMVRRPMTSVKNYLEVRNVADGKLQKKVSLPAETYYSLSFSDDGKRLAMAGDEAAVRIWSYPDFAPHHSPFGHTKAVTAMALSPDGKRAYSTAEDQSLIAWDPKSGQGIKLWDVPMSILGDPSSAHSLLATNDDHFFAAVWKSESFDAARRGTLHVHKLPASKELHTISVTGDVALSPNGQLLAVGFGANVRLLEPRTGKLVKTLEGHTKDVRRVAFSPDGLLVASAGSDGQLCLWHTSSGASAGRLYYINDRSRGTFASPPAPMAFSRDGRYIAIVVPGIDTALEAYEVASREKALTIKLPRTVQIRASHPVFVGQTVLLLNSRDEPIFFDLASGKLREEPIQFDPKTDERIPKTMEAGRLTVATLSADGAKLITGGADGYVTIWKADVLKGPPLPKADLSKKELTHSWQYLSDSAPEAFLAHWALASGGDVSAKFLGAKLRPSEGPNPADIAKRIADLRSDDLETRNEATREFEKWEGAVEFDLRKALLEKQPLHGTRRLEHLIARIDKAPMTNETLRAYRAIAVLESINTPAAREILQKLAGGAPGARLTVEAAASLRRMTTP